MIENLDKATGTKVRSQPEANVIDFDLFIARDRDSLTVQVLDLTITL